MSKRSTSATSSDDSTPITQADIDAGRLVLRKRKAGRVVPFKRRVNIYLDQSIVEYFKQLAGDGGYQTLINESLKQAIHAESIEKTLRKVIREELKNNKRQ